MPSESYYDKITSLTCSIRPAVTVRGIRALPTVGAEASFAHRVIPTPKTVVREVLKETLGIKTKKDQDNFMQGQSFYTLLLDLAVRMKDRVKTFLEYATFTVELGKKADILKVAPDKNGIQATLKKSKERSITISPSGEVGVGVAKIAGKFDYTDKKGWTLEVPRFITEIQGAKIPPNKAEWTINGNREIEIPGQRIGLTSVVNASMIVKLPRGMETKAEVKVDGRVVRDIKFFIDLHGPVTLISPEKLKIPQ